MLDRASGMGDCAFPAVAGGGAVRRVVVAGGAVRAGEGVAVAKHLAKNRWAPWSPFSAHPNACSILATLKVWVASAFNTGNCKAARR